ncbi:hypothetical protein JMUB7536_27650 [Staphylococcus aureus]
MLLQIQTKKEHLTLRQKKKYTNLSLLGEEEKAIDNFAKLDQETLTKNI